MKCFFIFLFLFACLSSRAQQQGLDPTFGNGGIVLRADGSPSGTGAIKSIAIQSDNKIIVAGEIQISRYNQNGEVDNGFGGNGLTNNVFNPPNVLIQTDGKIISAGGNPIFPQGCGIYRTLSNGAADNSFGVNGKVSTDSITIADALLQPDGKIVLVGAYQYNHIALLRFLPNGNPDSSFGINGRVFQYFAYPNGIEPKGASLMGDGRLVIGGHSTAPDSFFAMRFLPDGSPDTSFNHWAKASVAHLWPCAAVAIQDDGKVLLAGHTIFGDAIPFVLLRLNMDGSVDSNFGDNGIAVYQWESGEENKVRAMKIQPDGKIILAGRVGSENGHKYNFAMVRFLPDGQLDNSFGTNGTLQTKIQEDWDDINDIAIQSDGKIIASGSSERMDGFLDWAIVRYMPDGKTAMPDILPLAGRIKLYPNAADDRLFITYPADVAIQSLRLYDASGRLLQRWNNKVTEINLKDIAKGMYFLRIEEISGETLNKPFVVLH